MEKLTHVIFNLCLKLVTLVLMAILLYSVVEFIVIFIQALINHPIVFYDGAILEEKTFMSIVLKLIAAVLLILIILEIIELVKDYNQISKKDYLALVIEIAIISMVRHLIVLDYSHIEANVFLGIGAILLVICAFYLFLKSDKKVKDLSL